MYYGSIDLNKVDKSRIVTINKKTGKPFENGAKYLNVVVWINDTIDEFGNIASVQESITKDEKESGKKAVYIGNLKNPQGQDLSQKTETTTSENDGTDDLPF